MNRAEKYEPTIKTTLPGGREIYLTESEMVCISQHIRILYLQRTIRHEYPSWPEKKVKAVSVLSYYRMLKNDNGEEETEAISISAKEYDKEVAGNAV